MAMLLYLQCHFFTINNINVTFGRLVYRTTLQVVYCTVAEAFGGNLGDVGEVYFHDVSKILPTGSPICLFCTNGNIER